MSAIKKLFRQNLKWFREQQNISQGALSDRCDYDRTYVGKIERGEKEPSLEAIIRLSRALNVSMADFFRTDRPETNETAARAMKAGEDIYQILFDGAYRMVGLLNSEGQFIEVNDALVEFCRESREEILQLPVWGLSFWGSSEWRKTWLHKKVNGALRGELFQEEMKVFPEHENQPVTIDFSLTPVHQGEHDIEYVLAQAHQLQEMEMGQSLTRQFT